MDLIIVFQSSLYFAVAIASITLAIADASPFPVIMTLPLAVMSYWTVERRKLWSIDGWKSNVLAALAIGALIWELWNGTETFSRVIAGAHFLAYLTWIVLLQTKRIRQYWFLMALSWLQVAIASVLTDSPLFGLTLLVYLMLAVWTLSLFALYQGVADLVGERQLATASGPRPSGQRSGWGADWTAGNGVHSSAPSVAARAPSLLEIVNGPTRIRNSIQHDDRERWVTPRYAGGIMLIAFGGFIVGLAFFLLTPRFWMGEFAAFGQRHDSSSLPLGRQPVTGFSGQVQLGDLGTILENADPVLRVRLFDRTHETAITMDEFLRKYGLDAPVFRGNILDTYENGAWSAGDNEDTYGVVSRNRSFSSIRQEVTVVTSTTPFLFTLSPFLAIRNGQSGTTEAFPIRRNNSVIFNTRPRVRGPFEYWVYSPAEPLAPEDREPAFGGLLSFPRLSRDVRSLYLAVPGNLLRLRELAREIAESVPADKVGETGTADAIVYRLRDSLEYSYSLNASITDSNIDPVEDFLFNRKTGHCEYFATSLALLLRAQGIPARMVTGYRGVVDLGDNVYEVQQRHAHAWVEAWVDDRWLTLDATPPARDEEARSYGRDTDLFSSLSNSATEFWNTYIVGLNQDRQEQAFLSPIRDIFEKADRSGGGRGWIAFIKAVFGEFTRNPAGMLNITGLILLLMLAPPFIGIVLIARQLLGWIGARRTQAGLAGLRHRVPVPFFDRFLDECARHGWTPSPTQTAREFCGDVAQQMAMSALPGALHAANPEGVNARRDRGRNSESPHTGMSATQAAALADGPPLAMEIGHLFESVRYGQSPAEPTAIDQLSRRLAAWSEATKSLVTTRP